MKTRWIVSALLLLCILLAPAHPAVAQEEVVATTFAKFFLYPQETTRTYKATVQVDPAGGVHTTFYGKLVSGTRIPVYYAYCPAGCTDLQKWTAIEVGELGAWGDRLTMQLTPTGKPRLMWFYQASLSMDGEYRYAECDTACTNAANWKTGKAVVGPYLSGVGEGQYFAIDNNGKPRFIYSDTDSEHEGTFYRYCESACTVTSNWKENLLTSNYLTDKEYLAFTPAGLPKLAMRIVVNYTDYLMFAECTANCNSAAPTWKSSNLFPINSNYEFAFRLTKPSGQPRMILYARGDNDRLYYYSCDTTCTTAANWKSYALNLPAYLGRNPALALDSSNRPNISYTTDDLSSEVSGLRYGKCTANCESASATWSFETVETTDNLNVSSPIPPETKCSSIWLESGQKSSLALSPSNTPVITYANKHVQTAAYGCPTHTDLEVVRVAATSWSVEKPYKTYLPSLRKP